MYWAFGIHSDYRAIPQLDTYDAGQLADENEDVEDLDQVRIVSIPSSACVVPSRSTVSRRVL